MGGSRKDVRLRLQRAALELYAEHGYGRTTAADIAALAGVTERTYFRHFPDKREVLFDGDAELRSALAAAVAGAPAGLSPLPALLEAFRSAAPIFERDRAGQELRHRIVASTPELQERDLMKLALLTDALTEALERRATPRGPAWLAAACGTAVLTRARQQWLAGSQGDYATLLADAFEELGLLVSALGQQTSPAASLSPIPYSERNARAISTAFIAPDGSPYDAANVVTANGWCVDTARLQATVRHFAPHARFTNLSGVGVEDSGGPFGFAFEVLAGLTELIGWRRLGWLVGVAAAAALLGLAAASLGTQSHAPIGVAVGALALALLVGRAAAVRRRRRRAEHPETWLEPGRENAEGSPLTRLRRGRLAAWTLRGLGRSTGR